MAGTAEHPDPETFESEIPEEADDAIAGVSSWGISIVLHAIILLVMVFVVYQSMREQDEAKVVHTVIPPSHEPDAPPPHEDIRTEVRVDVKIPVPEAVVHDFEVPVEPIQTDDDTPTMEARGQEDAVSAMEMANVAFTMAIGPGNSAPGMRGRGPGGHRRAMGPDGSSPRSELAAEGALRWFVRHQSPNGQWDVDGYSINCQEQGPKCEPGTSHTDIQGDVACTGYALLCFLGGGYEHRSPNRYRLTVQKGVDWLLSVQEADGCFGKRNYEHPVATMALAEAYAMTNDPMLREPVQRAVDLIRARQAQGTVRTAVSGQDIGDYGLAWDYLNPNFQRMDSSVSGWNVMALKSAKMGGIDVGGALDGARQWLTGAWEAMNKQVGVDLANLDEYTSETQFPYTWDGSDNKVSTHNGDLTCVGLLCAVFLGAEDRQLKTMANWCFKHQTPQGWPTDTYYLYYNTLGMFQVGGEQWKAWNGTVRDMLVDAQRQDGGCFGGSWDPQGAGGHHVSEVGRLLVTAYCCMSLQVYYRYDVVRSDPKDERSKRLKAAF